MPVRGESQQEPVGASERKKSIVKSKILSLNISLPQTVEWETKSIETSMFKKPVDGLNVFSTYIEGDKFANADHHGTPDAVLYAYGVDALEDYVARLGRGMGPMGQTRTNWGELGENITVDQLNENEISVGDVFQIGAVTAQATFPRIPCVKINFCMKTALGQKAMIQAKRSGVYFRILNPGRIDLNSTFERIEKANVRFTIAEVYERMVGGVKVTAEDLARVRANGAFPEARITKWLPRTVLTLCLTLFSPFAFAQARSTGAIGNPKITPTLTFASRVQLAIQGEVESIKKLNERVKTGDHSLCASYRGGDMSGCAKMLIRSFTAHSANGVRALLDLPVSAAMKDRDLGVGDKRAGLLLADDFLTIIEGVRTEKFFAKTIRANTKRNRLDKKAVRVSENKLLEEFRLQALPTVETHLAKTELIRGSIDPEIMTWERAKAQELHARLDRLKLRRWKVQ